MAVSQCNSEETSRAMLIFAGRTQTPVGVLNVESMDLYNI